MADAKQELQELKKEYQDFAYTMSHDFSTPLRQINAFAQLIYEKHASEFDEETKKYFDFIFSGTQKGQDKIDALLVYSRLNTRAEPFKSIDLTLCYNQARKELGEEISASDATIEVGELPTVDVDAQQMVMLFYHMISNAIKFQPEGQAPIIHIDAQKTEAGLHINCRDNGIGIPEAYQEQVFDVFYRAVTEDEYPGTGIGLTLVQKIARRHGGDAMVADNDHGSGTLCQVTIYNP